VALTLNAAEIQTIQFLFLLIMFQLSTAKRNIRKMFLIMFQLSTAKWIIAREPTKICLSIFYLFMSNWRINMS